MKNMKTKIFTLSTVALLMFAGCTNDNEGANDPIDGEIRLSAAGLSVSTRSASQTIQSERFDNNEKMDIFMTDDAGSGDGYSSYAQPLVATAKTTSGVTNLTFDAGAQFWPIMDHSLNIWAVYPSGLATSAGTGVSFSVKADQSTDANYKASDLMTGIPSAGNPLPASKSFDASIPLKFNHLLTKININLSKTPATTEISDDELKKAKVTLLGILPTTTFTAKADVTQEVTAATGTVTDILLYDGNTKANDALTYSCIIVPQTIAAAAQFIKIELPTASNDLFVYATPSALTLDAQKVYTYNIKIHKASIILTAEIQDWGDGGDTDGTAYIQ